MSYEAPGITDLGQISKHVFVNFSPNGLNEDQTAGGEESLASGATVAAGSSGGLAGLGLIGGIAAALAGRSSNQQQVPASGTPDDEVEPDRPNER